MYGIIDKIVFWDGKIGWDRILECKCSKLEKVTNHATQAWSISLSLRVRLDTVYFAENWKLKTL